MPVLHKLSDLKLERYSQLIDLGDSLSLRRSEGNEVQEMTWTKFNENPGTWSCNFVLSQFRRVWAVIKYRLAPDYAPEYRLGREEWVYLTYVGVANIDDSDPQILADGYYHYFLEDAQRYCETTALVLCDQLGIAFPDGASILVDKTGASISRYRRVILPDGTSEANVSDFGWHKFYIPSSDHSFQHSPLDWAQVRPTVKYFDAANEWQSAPCSDVRVCLFG